MRHIPFIYLLPLLSAKSLNLDFRLLRTQRPANQLTLSVQLLSRFWLSRKEMIGAICRQFCLAKIEMVNVFIASVHSRVCR